MGMAKELMLSSEHVFGGHEEQPQLAIIRSSLFFLMATFHGVSNSGFIPSRLLFLMCVLILYFVCALILQEIQCVIN